MKSWDSRQSEPLNYIKNKENKMIEKFFDISEELLATDKEVMELCEPYFKKVEEVQCYNQLKVLKAFKENYISAQHLVGTTGYGYDDRGRDGLDRLFADIKL